MPTPISLEDIVAKTSDLPAVPAAALAVMRETERSEATAQSVARMIINDQSLTARVLRLANSSFYGLQRKIVSLGEAVVVLGLQTVKRLCLMAGTYPWLGRACAGYEMEATELWCHSYAVAIGAQMIAKKTEAADPEAAFTAGLLHDLGKVALNLWIDQRLNAMVQIALLSNATFDAVERRVLGYDHTDVGGHIGRSWNLPPSIVGALQFHHRPDEAEESEMVIDCVHLADALALSMGLGLGGDGLLYRVSDDALARLNLSESDMTALAGEFFCAYETQSKLFDRFAA